MKVVELSDGISLLSGAVFDYRSPVDCDATIEDIAAALSNVCRFSGHLPHFYSVAQHCVNASLIAPEGHQFDALMHDTAEAFTNDLPTPLKFHFPVFKELEVQIEMAMSLKFGFAYPLSPEIKLVDLQMLALEKRYVKQDPHHWPLLDGVEYEHHVGVVDLSSWHPTYARHRFLQRYQELKS